MPLGVWSEWLATLGAALPDRSLARPHLWLKPAVSHDTREDDGDNDQRSDDTAQHPANGYVRDDVSDAVCLRPEVTDDPAAQLQGHDDREPYAPGPPVTQPPTALSPASASAGTGFRSGREGVGRHAAGSTMSSGAGSRSAIAFLPGQAELPLMADLIPHGQPTAARAKSAIDAARAHGYYNV